MDMGIRDTNMGTGTDTDMGTGDTTLHCRKSRT